MYFYKRRLKGYSSVGYQVKSNVSSQTSVVISATKLRFSKHSSVLDILKDLLARGVEVITVVKSNLEKEERIKSTGASIRVNDSLAIDTAIIDKSLIWYGSINYLGYNTDENNAIRIYDSTLAENILEELFPV